MDSAPGLGIVVGAVPGVAGPIPGSVATAGWSVGQQINGKQPSCMVLLLRKCGVFFEESITCHNTSSCQSVEEDGGVHSQQPGGVVGKEQSAK